MVEDKCIEHRSCPADFSLPLHPAVFPEAKGCADDLHLIIWASFHGDSFEFRSCLFRSVESVLSQHEIYYTKTELFIDSEELYEVLYEMEV